MRSLEFCNGCAALTALALATGIMASGKTSAPTTPVAVNDTQAVRYAVLTDGRQGIVDATNQPVALGDYQRIVAGSIVARSILGELCEPDRIAGVLSAGIEDAPNAHRFSGIKRLDSMNEIEKLLTLDADLIIVNSVLSIPHAQRLREKGIAVFVLGDMRGVDSFVRDVQQISALIGHPKRGKHLARGFLRRIQSVAQNIPMPKRKTGIYLGAYGSQMFGGTVGTSYHDVLTYAGLIDIASLRFTGWPQYSLEHVLTLDPEIIVSPNGVPEMLCQTGALTKLRACADNHSGFVELPSSWLEDPSLIMLDVAESIKDAVYGAQR